MFAHNSQHKFIHQYFADTAQTYPHKIAIEENTGSLTFEQLFSGAHSMATFFIKRGFKPGDRVLVLIPKSARAILVLFAASFAGGTYIGPVSVTYNRVSPVV